MSFQILRKVIFLLFLVREIICLNDGALNITLSNCQILYTQSSLKLVEDINIISCSIKKCIDQNGSIVNNVSKINLNNKNEEKKIKCQINKYQTKNQCFARCCSKSFQNIEECINFEMNQQPYQTIGIVAIVIFSPCIFLLITFLCIFGTGLLISPFSTILILREKFRKTNIINSRWISIQFQQTNKIPEKQKECLICLEQNCDSTLQCKHSFHLSCLKSWLKVKKSCPTCRQKQKMIIEYFCRKCFKQMYSFKTFQQAEYIVQIKDCPQCEEKQKQIQSSITLQRRQLNSQNRLDQFV